MAILALIAALNSKNIYLCKNVKQYNIIKKVLVSFDNIKNMDKLSVDYKTICNIFRLKSYLF